MNIYELFMQEYLEEAYMESQGFYENVYTEDAGKEGVYKENYYFRDNLQIPYIKDVLAKPKIQESIINYVGKFLDDHTLQLSTSGPVHIFTFDDKETKFFYDMFNLSPEVIMEMYYKVVEVTYNGKISQFITGWVKSAPHKILITSMLIDALQNGYEDIVTCCEYLWAFTEYPLIYRSFWKTGVKEDVMNYTIEHLGTRYKVKKVKNLQGLLKYDAHSSVVNMTDRLKTGADNVYVDLVYRMRNQIKNTFKNIANAYYDNDDENASQHSKSSQFDDGSLADQEGHTTNISQIVENTISKFSSGEINNSMIRIAAEMSQIDKNNLANYITQIKSTKNNRMNKLVENIITSYFNKHPTNDKIIAKEFLNFGLALYRSIGTSKDPMYQEIKAILNYWMYEVIDIKQFYQREGTWINYTRAIFNYVILMINYYN